jgi:iron complex outermembrane receptor protein
MLKLNMRNFSKSILLRLAAMLMVLPGAAMGQQVKVADTLLHQHHLHEVKITDELSDNDALLKFYKANKTSSTEDILSRLSGVNLMRRGSYGMEPMVRGFSGGQINLTIDGMKIFGACTDRMDPASSYIEPGNLKSISLSTTATGAMFGSNIGGSLDFKLAEATLNPDREFTGNFATSYASVSQATNNLLQLNYGKERWAMRLSGIYRKAQNYKSADQTVAFTQFEKLNLNLSGKYQLGEHSYLRADILADEGRDMGYAALPMDVAYAKARIFSLSYRTHIDAPVFEYLEAKVYGNRIKHAMDDTQRPLAPIHMDMPGWSNTSGAYAETLLKWKKDHRLTVRTDAYRNLSRAEMTMYPQNSAPMFMLTWPDSRRNVVGFFARDEWTLNDKSALNFNARLEYASSVITNDFGRRQMEVFNYKLDKPNERFLKNFSADYNHQLSSKFYTSFSFGFAERLPTVSEWYGFYLFNAFDGYDYIGNPNLNPEQSIQGELTLGYKTSDAQVSFTAFNNYIKDYIIGAIKPDYQVMTIGARGVKEYQQLEHADLRGFELNINAKIGDHLHWISNARYTYGRDYAGGALPLVSPFKILSSVKYSFKTFGFQLENDWAASQSRVSRIMGEQVTPAFTVWNIRSSYQHKLKKNNVEVNAGIENLFNRFYHEHLDWGQIPRPGRNFYVGMAYAF